MCSDWADRARIHGVLADPHRLAALHHVALGDQTPKLLAELLDIPMPLLSHHLNVLAESGLITRTTSEQDRRKRFVTLHSSAVGYLDRTWLRERVAAPSGRVVFACTHNSARSVLAAALWSDRFNRPTAAGGTTPGSRIHPTTVRTARRHRLPLLQSEPTPLRDVLGPGDLLVTVCDAANEHVESHPHRLHWSIPDPAASGDTPSFEAAFDRLRERIDRLGSALVQPTSEESKG
ncbi:MAG: helix-turn-helix domain-containing protein [Actinomycetota bacterium]|nr:helix-turn-helix domain-containing protein [Actinomycetota bacterium]